MTKKLTNISKNSKAYWLLLRRFSNNKKYLSMKINLRKILSEKDELLNFQFATQCSLIIVYFP